MERLSLFFESVVPIALLVLGLQRLDVYRKKVDTRPTTNILILLGTAQALRIHAIADDHIDPFLQQLTGVWNLTALVAMSLGVCACVQICGLAAHAIGKDMATWERRGLSVVLVSTMVVSFLASDAPRTPTGYLSQTFPATGPMLVYWVVFIGSIAGSVSFCLYYLTGLIKQVKSGTMAPVLIAVAVACVMGIAWCGHKVTYLIMRGHDVENWYTEHTRTVSLILILSPLALIGCAMAIYLVAPVPQRVSRYRKIRAHLGRWKALTESDKDAVLEEQLIPHSRYAAWRASRNSIASVRMMTEIADVSPPQAFASDEMERL